MDLLAITYYICMCKYMLFVRINGTCIAYYSAEEKSESIYEYYIHLKPCYRYLDTSKVCTSRPTKVSCSSTCVIDLSKLTHPNNIKNDNEVWSHSGSHPQIFRVHIETDGYMLETDGYMQVEKCAAGATGNDVVYIHRLQCASIYQVIQEYDCLLSLVSTSL